ncbi:GNAT family N-acetyltransferase [Sphingobacterium sp.]|uniref:GNAT family N-acetyltransferase n=1 Tax=Sphingobacterium sp. TaxID=341027 RepID=UPI00289751B7|nr:GNAT family N-acetyltransferase [Sphingobacterium sp.]
MPRYDHVLAHYLAQSATATHIRIDFPALFTELYIPLAYDSAVGQHQFQFPAFERQTRQKTVVELSLERFCVLAAVDPLEESQATAFSAAFSSDKVPLAAMLSPGSSEDKQPHILRYIQHYSANHQLNNREAVKHWFHQYLHILGYKQLDAYLTIDDNGFPVAVEGMSIAANDPAGSSQWIAEVLVGHVFKLIGLIGSYGLQDEENLIALTYHFYKCRAQQQDPLAAFIIGERHFTVKNNLRHGAEQAVCTVPNVLHEVYWDAALLRPASLEPVFSKTYPKEQVTVSIRPFDLDRDLEMVHRWFHREHAKTIWKMDWDLPRLEQFYRSLLADKDGHAYIGEINGVPTFNMEVYWATRDIVGNYFDVLPTDYGTHLFIAPTEREKKFPSLTMQTIVSWLFAQPKVGRLVGEGAVESMAALMNKIHVGFKLQGIIEMPHKKAHLNFCYREWYWEKFPQHKPHAVEAELTETY